MKTIIGNLAHSNLSDMTDNVLSQRWLAQNKSMMTSFNSIDYVYRIAFGNTAFHISMAKDSLHYLSKEQV